MELLSLTITERRRSGNDLVPLFVFDNPLKFDSTVKWTLNVNDAHYPLDADSLVLDNGIAVKNFHLTGYISLEEGIAIVPYPLQDTIQSKKYNVKDSNNNVYHIAFPVFVNDDIFNYKPLHDSLKLNGNILRFEGIKLKKPRRE